MNNPNKETLLKVKNLIANRENWVQGTFAKDKYNFSCPPWSTNACKFCLLGALEYVNSPVTTYEHLNKLLDEHTLPPWMADLAGFNDTHSHDDVMAFLDKAIECA